MKNSKIIFITGTDTGVGKTLFAALLLHHLRASGCHVLAMKPFCSGGRADVNLLQSLQPGEISDREMNPFYFAQAIAPSVAARGRQKSLTLKQVVAKILRVQKKCDCLVIEGSGGLLVPLGKNFTVADLIVSLPCEVVVMAHNRLGTINHTLLTTSHLRRIGAKQRAVVLMNRASRDLSSRTNHKTLSDLLKPLPVFSIPYLGERASRTSLVRKNASKLRAGLRSIAQAVGLS